MIRAKLLITTLRTVAALGLVVTAWVAYAGQAVVDRPKVEAPAAAPNTAVRTVDLDGNWIIRGYPSAEAVGLIKIEGSPRQAHATLLSIMMPDRYRFAESRVEPFRIDAETVRFTLELTASRAIDSRTIGIVAYLPKDEVRPRAVWGSMEVTYGRQISYVFPAKLERTGRNEIDPKEGSAPEPGNDDLTRVLQTNDLAKCQEILEGMLKKYHDTPMAPLAARNLAINQAETKAPETEVRALVDQAARIAARYGRELEIGDTNLIIQNLIGNRELVDLVLERARKAVALLRPSDSVALQTSTLKNLASALRKARKIDESKAVTEAKAVEDRIAKLGSKTGDKPTRTGEVNGRVKTDQVVWARNFDAARKEAKAKGKLILVDFYTESCGWCKRLDSDVFPQPAVSNAIHQFVPVRINAEDGEGRPLVEQYQSHIQGYPAILFLDPAIENPKDGRIVGKIPGFMPPLFFAEQLNIIAHLPHDVEKLQERHKAHPDDKDEIGV